MDVHEDERAFLREVMSAYPTGVTVVAGCDPAGDPYGLTVNSFTSVSLDPPLVLVCIGHNSSCHDRLVSAPSFAVNVLSAEQGALAYRFAGEPSEERFAEVDWKPGRLGAPVLAEAAAWLECSIHEVLDGGDHAIVIGRVEASAVTDRPVLLFHRGKLSRTET